MTDPLSEAQSPQDEAWEALIVDVLTVVGIRGADARRVPRNEFDHHRPLIEAAVLEAVRERMEAAVHEWFCGKYDHNDRRRPEAGWACERGAAVVLAALREEGT